MRLPQVGGHVAGIVEVSNRRREMGFSCQQNLFCASSQVALVLFGEDGNRKRIPTQGIRITIPCFQLAADCCYPSQMQGRCNDGKIPQGSIVNPKQKVAYNYVAVEKI